MDCYGIIGYPLGHTFSPGYFTKKFADEGIDAVYKSFPLEQITELPELLQQQTELRGLNVTIPYKEAVLQYLDETDAAAKAVGAVNCIHITDGNTKGYNTDIIGFEQSLLPLLQPHHRRALVLGTGGAAKAVAYVLNKLGIDYRKVSRSGQPEVVSYDDLTPELISAHTLIINTTPLGMYPDIYSFPPIPYDAIGAEHLLYDLIYNPAETRFLSLGKANGATVKNGMEMLHLQAEASWQIWTGHYNPTV
ncbi:shikimate dehydrogenase family protein [Polluticoccus soli]|uniref:shikimate dehydrogenase family protein n=1 Tax=Polluticoccus soli TaxID=3034150 RepID=UPI0023E15A91|nr:shikimate dehydrogenase [Flavipsychrobacter sp. JY13-12]